MIEYINKADAIKAVFDCERYTGIDEAPYEYADDLLNKLPTIDIVRCKDCKHRNTFGIDAIDCRSTSDNWFCADGERRQDD